MAERKKPHAQAKPVEFPFLIQIVDSFESFSIRDLAIGRVWKRCENEQRIQMIRALLTKVKEIYLISIQSF